MGFFPAGGGSSGGRGGLCGGGGGGGGRGSVYLIETADIPCLIVCNAADFLVYFPHIILFICNTGVVEAM